MFSLTPFCEGLGYLQASHTACGGVQTEASREEGLAEGLYVPSWEVGDVPGLVLFCTAQVPALALEVK